jgi:hypothetical protein
MGVLVLAGGGGFGKTRTGLEICRAAEDAGWTAGPIDADEAGVEGLSELAAWPGRLLVVVDYAETRPGLVSALLRRLRRRSGPAVWRVVLVVRQRADRQTLIELVATGDAREEVARLLRRAEWVGLGVGQRELDRRVLFTTARSAFTHTTTGPALPQLYAEHFARPLFVLAAALLQARDPGLNVGGLSEDDLLGEVLERHETRYWRRAANQLGLGLHPEDQRIAVALMATVGLWSDTEDAVLVRKVPALADASIERVMLVVRWLRSLYGEAGVLEPDLLGEVLAAGVFTANPALVAAALDEVSQSQRVRALLVLSRVAGRGEPVRVAVRDALDARLPDLVAGAHLASPEFVAALLLAVTAARPMLGAAKAQFRVQPFTVATRQLAVALGQVAVNGLRDLTDPTAQNARPMLAAALLTMSNHLAGVGRPDERLAPITEAVGHYRALAETDPTRFLPELAGSLNNQSVHLTEAGRPGEGLAPITEAVGHFRALAETDPTRFLPDLASSLNTQSNLYAEVGLPGEGLAPMTEAVGHYRALAETDPTRFLPDLAMALNTQSNRYAQIGRPREGLAPITEAVGHYRALAKTDPTRFLPDLAMALTNHAARLTELDRCDDARSVFDEALDEWRAPAWPRAVLLLGRAALLSNTDPDQAARDSLIAAELTEVADDRTLRGQARSLVRSLAVAHPDAVATAWSSTSTEPPPVWLRFPEFDSEIAQLLIDWVGTDGWDASFTFLAARTDALLTDQAEATLEHLVDRNPHSSQLDLHLQLLREARAHGVDAARDEFAEQEAIRHLTASLQTWIATPSWSESAEYLTRHAEQLLTDRAEDLLAVATNDQPSLLVYLALLALAREQGVPTAHTYLTDPAVLDTALRAATGTGLLHLARLHAAQHPDTATAHLTHALAAASLGAGLEAAWAARRCRDNSASWEQAALLAQLEAFATENPDVDITPLRATLTEPANNDPTETDQDNGHR